MCNMINCFLLFKSIRIAITSESNYRKSALKRCPYSSVIVFTEIGYRNAVVKLVKRAPTKPLMEFQCSFGSLLCVQLMLTESPD